MISSVMRLVITSKYMNDFEWNYRNGEERELHDREIGRILVRLFYEAKTGFLLRNYSKTLVINHKTKESRKANI
jgi:hypothetical protein